MITDAPNQKWGYVDATGNMRIEPTYRWAESFSEGLAAVYTKDVWGYIDTYGKMVIKPQFISAGPFREGLAPVSSEAGFGYIVHPVQ